MRRAGALVNEQLDRLKAFWERFIKTRGGSFQGRLSGIRQSRSIRNAARGSLARLARRARAQGRRRGLADRDQGLAVSRTCRLRRQACAGILRARPGHHSRGGRVQGCGRRGTPFLLLIGSSGSGKSSLARAGLGPRLTTPGVVGAVDRWRVAMMRPGRAQRRADAGAGAMPV